MSMVKCNEDSIGRIIGNICNNDEEERQAIINVNIYSQW
jgi:hypothetical protein